MALNSDTALKFAIALAMVSSLMGCGGQSIAMLVGSATHGPVSVYAIQNQSTKDSVPAAGDAAPMPRLPSIGLTKMNDGGSLEFF